MSQQQGILELIQAFQSGQLDAPGFTEGLGRIQQFCEKKLRQLEQTHVGEADKALWEATLLPGLEACYEGLMGAAAEAQLYAEQRDEQILAGVHYILGQVGQALAIVESASGEASAETQAAIADMAPTTDGISLQSSVQSGSATSEVRFLE